MFKVANDYIFVSACIVIDYNQKEVFDIMRDVAFGYDGDLFTNVETILNVALRDNEYIIQDTFNVSGSLLLRVMFEYDGITIYKDARLEPYIFSDFSFDDLEYKCLMSEVSQLVKGIKENTLADNISNSLINCSIFHPSSYGKIAQIARAKHNMDITKYLVPLSIRTEITRNDKPIEDIKRDKVNIKLEYSGCSSIVNLKEIIQDLLIEYYCTMYEDEYQSLLDDTDCLNTTIIVYGQEYVYKDTLVNYTDNFSMVVEWIANIIYKVESRV